MAIEYAQELVGLVERARAIEETQVKKSQELIEREALIANKEKDLDLRKQNLDSREAILVPIENMAQWRKEVQSLSDKNANERETLEADKKKWATQVQADKGQIEQDRLLAKKEADMNEINRNNIEALVTKRVKEVLCQYGQTDLAAKV